MLGAAKISPHEVHPKKNKPESKRGEVPGRSRVKAGVIKCVQGHSAVGCSTRNVSGSLARNTKLSQTSSSGRCSSDGVRSSCSLAYGFNQIIYWWTGRRRTGRSNEVGLLPSEEKQLDDLDLGLLRLKGIPESAMSEEDVDTLTAKKSSKH